MRNQSIHQLIKLLLILAISSVPVVAQLSGFSKEDLIKYTADTPYERFEDGRPKVPDQYIEALKISSSEMVFGPLRRAGYTNQWVDGWKLLQPDKKLVGRVFTAQFMPARSDVNDIIEAEARGDGKRISNNQRVINRLQPGDVLVVDLFGKIEKGTFVGDNLAAAVFAATGNGFVIDGAVRDLDGIVPQGMPGYVRGFHVSALADVMLTGVNVPIRIGTTTVMPGDIVLGDREGLTFIPSSVVADVAKASKLTELHDVWTKQKFATGKYQSSDLYPRPSDPALIKEFEDWRDAELAKLGMEPVAPQKAEQQVTWEIDNLKEIGGHKVIVEGKPKVINTPQGKAVEFDGVDDGIFLDVHPLAGMTEFTVEIIFRPDAGGPVEQRFFHMQENDSEERVMFETRLVEDNRWFMDAFIQTGDQNNTMYAVGDQHEIGPWYHAAIVVDGSTFKHYVNGQMELGKEIDFEPPKSGRTSLGVRINKVFWFKGAIRKARFTPRAMTPNEFLTAED